MCVDALIGELREKCGCHSDVCGDVVSHMVARKDFVDEEGNEFSGVEGGEFGPSVSEACAWYACG